MRDNQKEVLERFTKDVLDHRMTVVKDDGIHRHLSFRRPNTYCYGFDIVTWPGYLAITGDMGAAVFSRLDDMFEFFRSKPDGTDELFINIQYWAEKCVANDGEKVAFRSDLFEKLIKRLYNEHVSENEAQGFDDSYQSSLWDHLESEVIGWAEDTRSALETMYAFENPETDYPNFRLDDCWEYGSSLEEHTFHFIWRLYAIAYAIRTYDASK